MVAHKYRGKGVAASLIKMAHAILKEYFVNFSILFAADVYYLSSGYIPMKNLTRFIENNEKKEFIYDGGMVCELGSQNWNVNILELNGEVV
ncbi:hypothetical protein [Proteus mirabilis]|uniref:hypothetical protein n=1 Tax=Proteus mirabilis TaxID=584 RepID=UPI0034DCF103